MGKYITSKGLFTRGVIAATAIGLLAVAALMGAAAPTSAATLPTISINDARVTEGDSGSSAAVFTVRLSAASTSTVAVNFATATPASGNAATAGSDYVATSGTLTFAAGVTTRTISVQVRGDTMYEPAESAYRFEWFQMLLSNPAGATITDGEGRGFIEDQDPFPTLSVQGGGLYEGDSDSVTMIFNVRLSNPTARTVSVTYRTVNGSAVSCKLCASDYGAVSGTRTMVPGQTAFQVVVPVYGDTVREADETFFLELTDAANALLVTEPVRAQATIRNDD
jgi:hypothetical protein